MNKKNKLVILHKMEPFTTSEIVANGTKNDHRSIVRLIKRYKEDFKDFGDVITQIEKTKGRHKEIYLLDEDQVNFLISLMNNSVITVSFKKKIALSFKWIKKHMLEIAFRHKDTEWLQARTGIIDHYKARNEVVKEYIDLAIEQGSETFAKRPELAYTNINKMQYQALFIIEQKYANVRDVLTGQQLDVLKVADDIVKKCLREELDKKTHYKEIFKICRDKVLAFVELIGQSPVGYMLKDRDELGLE